ncbi:unnamed protein product [Arabidopsis arenosa]|uniref:Uncharacterized protein n=1 Tax=Arabidopsis arenosa TaxID=38785 RepID=A0A8S2A770_ARAAE|nr:unnamed protein product [Arabidopsis arenosa]
MMVTALQILFSLIRYVTETIRSVSVLFSDSEDEPDDEASSSDKDVSDATLPARTTYSIVIFLAGSVRRDKREMLSISQKGTLSPAMLPRPAYRGIEREDRGGPEQVGLGYRAVSAVGCERGRARTVHRRRVCIREGNHRSDVPLTQPGNGPEGTAAWVMSASRRKAHFELWVIGRASGGQLYLIKGRGTRVLRDRAKPLGCLSRLGDRSAIGVLRDINQGNKCRAYNDAARFHFMEVPGRGKGCR